MNKPMKIQTINKNNFKKTKMEIINKEKIKIKITGKEMKPIVCHFRLKF